MNEEVINDLYNNAVSKGYKKSREEFVSLLQSNDAVMNDMYSYVQSKGYKKGINDFKGLIGANVESPMATKPVAEQPKKKEDTVSPFVAGGSELTKFDPRTGQVVQDAPAFAQKQPEVKIPEQKLPSRAEFQFQPGKPLPTQKASTLPKFVEEQLSAVTPDLIGKTEENVVPQLKYQFGPLGFKFEETGVGDYMKATSPSGESIEISLDITDPNDRKAEANKLNAFLRKGTTTVKNLSTLQRQYVDANKKITSQKELDDSLASINAEEAKVMARNAEFAKLQTSLESERARLESVPPQQRNNPEYIARVNDFISKADQFTNDFQTFINDTKELEKRGQQLNKSIGKYTQMKAQQGTWYGAAFNAVANKSFYNMAKGFSGLAIDFLGEVIPTQAIMSQDDYEKNFIEQAKKEGIDVPEGQDFISFTSKLDEATIAKVENRVRDVAKKTVKSDIIGSLNKASNMAMESSGVSPEYYRSIEETFVGGALLGALTSIPAMAGGPVARTILMSSQVLAGLDDEMNNDPAFADVSENEKLLVKAPIAVAVGILENIGLSNLMNQKGFLNGLVFRALGRVGTGSSYRTFGEAIRNEIDSAVARGALIMGAGVLAEVETGALQEVADITAKEIYNMAKEKEMFNTPDSIVQFVKEVGKAGIQEGIGAGVLTIPGSISAAYRGKGFLGMDDAQFAMFEKMANDSNIEKGFVARLKSRINAGEITTAEGKDILNNYRNSVSLFNSLPNNLDMQGKKEAMNLLKERRDLERQIDGKDQSLTVPQRNRINEINQQLTGLSEAAAKKDQPTYKVDGKDVTVEAIDDLIKTKSKEELLAMKIEVNNDQTGVAERLQAATGTKPIEQDAIQEQAAGQVPVQPGTGVGQEVAQGEPQAEPQGITKENIQEKIAENNNKAEELRNRQKAELEELNKRENKNYADAFDILNVNEYSQDQTPRSQDAIDLANRHEKEFNDLLQEKRNIESEAEKLTFSDYNLTDTNKLDRLRESINSVYQNNRGALDEGFEIASNALNEANEVGGSDYVAHGMGKTNLANAYNDLINLFNKGINPVRGRGSLDVAPLSGGVSTGTTASGNAYMEGSFTLVANRNHSGPITNINQIGGIIVNEGLATPEVLTSLRDLFPNLVIESTSNTRSLVEQLNTKIQTEPQVQEEVVPTTPIDVEGEISLLEQLLAQEETAPTQEAGISVSSETDVNDLRNRTQSRSQQATTKEEKESANTRVKIIDTAKKAINTLKSIFPDVDIVIHDDEGSYNAAMLEVKGKAGSRGNFFIDTTPDGKTTGRIDINLSKANSRTVAHEIAHGILLKTFGDNKNLFNDFRTRMSKVLKGDVNQQLNDFANQYVDPATGELLDVNHEEFLAELTGILEQQEANVSVTTMQKVAALINEFVSKITGGKFKPFEDTKNTKDVVDFFNTISSAIREGGEIQKLNIQEPYSSGVAIPVINPNEFVGKKFRSQLNIGDYKFPSGIEILRIANIPVKTLTELVRQYEGRVVIITSDATGYGVDRNGDPILGGFGFASNEKNVSDGIGFASVSTGTVKGTYTAAEKAYGTGKTLVLVMIQPPHTTINNSYGAKYIIRGIKEIAASSKEELRKTKDAIKEFIKGSTAIQKELKNTDANFKRGSEKRLFDLIDSIDENTNLDEAVKEFLNDTTFTIRKELGKGIILENKDIRVNKSTNYSKIALNNVGYNIYDFLKEYGDNTFLDDDIILNNIGGFVVGGFELDVLPKEQREALINDIQSKGIVHPLFNAKLPGTNHFRLDALYDVQENFSEYAVPDTQISISNEERDSLVREIYKDDKFYKAEARKIPLEERSYTNLTVPAKTEFKNKYLKPQGLLIEAVPNVPTKVAKGEGFIPKEGAAEKIAKGTFVSRSQLAGNDAQRIVNLGRANGLSEQAISTVLQKRGFTQEAIDAALGKSEPAAKKVEVTEEFAPGYDRVLDEIAGIVEKSRKRGRSEAETMQNAINYLEGTKVYENATDVQREAMVRNVRKEFKKREKAAPSAEKVVGKPKKKEVTVDEMAALKDQIKLEARAAREAKGDLNAKRKALAARIIAARRKGTITAVQARALVNRISKVNLDNPIMVDRLLEYTDKVFDNANYAADMAELRKLQKQARSRNHTSMTNVVNQFTSINPEDIPLDRIQDYKEALDFLNTRTPFYGNMNEIFDEMLSYKVAEKFDAVKTKDALMDKYKSIIANEVKTVEDYVALIKDLNAFKRKAFQLLQNDAITQEEYDDLINGAGETQAVIEKKFAEQIAKIKKGLIAEIKKQRPRVSRDFSKEENDLIRKYLELSDADLESLSPEDLFILNDLLDNISNGEIDNFRFNEIISKAYTSDGANRLAKQIDDSKFDMTPEEGTKELSEYESSFWEGLLGMGRAKSGALQKFVVSVFNRAIASYENLTRDGYNEFLKLKKKYKMSDKDMHKIGMLTTYLQEYMAQFDPKNEGIKDIGKRDWFKEILSSKSMRGKYSSGKPSVLKVIGLGKSEIDIIEEIWDSLPKDKDGNVNPKAVYDSYMANDGKFFTKNEKGFFDDVMAYKTSEITPKQKFANEINGSSFKEIPFHMMRVRLDGGRTQITPTASSDNGVVRIKAGTGKERVSEAVGPIMTNFEKLFITNLEQTGRDYFLSGALKDINNTLSGAKKKIDPEKMPLLDTISGTLSEALGYEFDRTRTELILRSLLSARAATTLLNPIRTAIELGATLASYPLRARTLSGYKDLFGKQKEMSKLLEFTNSPLRLRQNINNAIDINDGRIEPQSRLTKATAYLSGLPERTMMVTSWLPTFKSEFKDITGLDFDMKKFNDSEAYREKYGKAVKEASAVADAQTEKIIGPTTKAGQRREVRIAPKVLANIVGLEGTVSKNTAAGQILGFFSNYPYREVTEFVNGFKEAAEVIKDEGALSSLSQLQKPLGIALNVAAYGFLGSLAYAAQNILLGDEDDEERGNKILKDLMTTEGFLNELASNAISLAGSKYAAGGKALLQLAATIAIESTDDEEQKAKIKKLLKDSVFVDPLPVEQAAKFGGREKALSAIAMYIPQFVILADRYADFIGGLNEVGAIYDKIESKGIESLTQDEGAKILALNTIFNASQIVLNLAGTSIPAYNYIKTYMNKLKEDAGVSDVYKGESPAKKSSGGGGGGGRLKTINKTDLKKYFPDQYNELYGKESATYEIEQEVKAFEKEQREMKKRIKDQVYGGKD